METAINNIVENNKLIAEFIGYYQPKEVKDDLFSFEVYASLEECKKDYPNDEIIEYTGKDIEDFAFVDEPKYHTSWDWLMPVVENIRSLGYNVQLDNNMVNIYHLDTYDEATKEVEPIYFYLSSDTSLIENLYLGVVEFINHYNKNIKQ